MNSIRKEKAKVLPEGDIAGLGTKKEQQQVMGGCLIKYQELRLPLHKWNNPCVTLNSATGTPETLLGDSLGPALGYLDLNKATEIPGSKFKFKTTCYLKTHRIKAKANK